MDKRELEDAYYDAMNRIEQYKKTRDRWYQTYKASEAKLRKLEYEFQRYGRHDKLCSIQDLHTCSCGFSKVKLRGIKEPNDA